MVFLIPFRTGWRTQRFGTFDFWSQSSHDHLGFLKMGLPQFQLIIIYYHHVPSIFPLDYRSCALCIPHFQAAIAAWALDALRSLNGETLMGPKSQQAEVGLNEIKTFWVSPIGQFVWSLWYIYIIIYIYWPFNFWGVLQFWHVQATLPRRWRFSTFEWHATLRLWDPPGV